MTDNDVIVIAFCGLLGFGVVWLLLSLRSRPELASGDTNAEAKDTGPARNDVPEWYYVLEVAQTATMDEIRAAYHRKVMQYHPDRVETLGREFKRMAESRTREINQAYDIACRARR